MSVGANKIWYTSDIGDRKLLLKPDLKKIYILKQINKQNQNSISNKWIKPRIKANWLTPIKFLWMNNLTDRSPSHFSYPRFSSLLSVRRQIKSNSKDWKVSTDSLFLHVLHPFINCYTLCSGPNIPLCLVSGDFFSVV